MAARNEALARLTDDLTRIVRWGLENLVTFNASKTQFLHLTSRHQLPEVYNLSFDGSNLVPSGSLNILGVSLSPDLSWKEHIASMAKRANMRLGVLRRLRSYFSNNQMLAVYRGLVRPCMEYASPVWGGSSHVSSLDRVQRRAVRLIGAPVSQSLESRRRISSLSLFYRYYFGYCSAELAGCLPPPLRRVRGTRQAEQSHMYAVQPSNPRVGLRRDTFFCAVVPLWNALPSLVFPPSYNMDSFKREMARLPLPRSRP